MNVKNINKEIAQLVTLIVTVVLLVLYGIFWKPNNFEEPSKKITVSKGETFSSLADSLLNNGIISNKRTFTIAGRILGVTHAMRVGKYVFRSGLSNLEILNDIETGRSSVAIKVTIVEGERATQIASQLTRELGIDSSRFMSFLSDTSLIGIHPNGSSSLEGYLLPDTYEFFWQDDEEHIINTLLREFRSFYVDSLRQRAKQMKLSLNDVLTMASIVEGEAMFDDERAVIAGVYYNRLKKRMRLQADPTVQYAISDTPRRLTYDDLKFDSPYNTYQVYGLPPGPINNPGRQSILAALYPAKHHYIYFVSNNNGRHRFARTYAEHLRNVRAYRRARSVAMSR